MPMSIVITLEPPYEKSGSVTPTTGRSPVTMPRLKTRVPEDEAPDADGEHGAEAVLAPSTRRGSHQRTRNP